MIPHHYKEVSVKKVSFALEKGEIIKRLKGEKIYITTRYVILNNGSDRAVVKVRKTDTPQLFQRVLGVIVVSLPGNTVYCEDDSVDVHNKTMMARLASRHGNKAVVVKGRFEHISFIKDEPVLDIEVIDVEPPPSRLMILADEVLRIMPLKRAVRLVPKIADLSELVNGLDTDVILPCRASGLKTSKRYHFLDERPDLSKDEIEELTLVGCGLSKRIFKSIYKVEPRLVNVCPKDKGREGTLTLTRCCMAEGPEIKGDIAVLPWGANVDEVAWAMKALVKRSMTVGTGARDS